MRSLLTAVATIALVAGAAHAQGNGKGGGGQGGQGGGQGQGQAAAAGGSGGGGGKPDRAERGQGSSMQAGTPRQGGGSKDRANAANQGNAGGDRAERGNSGVSPATPGNLGERGNNNSRGSSGERAQGNTGRGNEDRAVVVDRGRGNDSRAVVIEDRGRGNRGADLDVVRVASFGAIPSRGLIAGCPPGLAKKNPPCVPPGQVRSPFRGYDRPDFWGLRLGDGRYWYDNGYLMRLGADGRIGGYIPLLGGALAIGNAWPTYYRPVALPTYYESYYGLGPYNSYRYADNVIYRIDPETAAITSIAALLTGDDFAIGRPMAVGYDVYNVPYSYREQYYDRPDAWYRYSDGYVYQIDPETRLIAAAIELIAS